jgi:eukaryotic-like serine/threonine-protein kinase
VPRPVSGARGAASVPSGPPVQPPQPYRPPYAQPVQPAPVPKPEGSGGRQVLIVLAVVLALLVLLCAGVISFLYKQGKQNSSSIGRSATMVVAHKGTADGEPLAASYRLTRQAGANPGWNRANEGRQTL